MRSVIIGFFLFFFFTPFSVCSAADLTLEQVTIAINESVSDERMKIVVPFHQKIHLLRKELLDLLENRCKGQMKGTLPPSYSFKVRDFDIENWPEGISKVPERWSLRAVEQIKGRLDRLNFRRLQRDFVMSTNPASYFDPEQRIEFSQIHGVILLRFKEESGWNKGTSVVWSLLNRDLIPKKYLPLILYYNTDLITNRDFCFDHEFMNSIHFYRYTEDELLAKLMKYRPYQPLKSIDK